MRIICVLVFLIIVRAALAKDILPIDQGIDILHYRFELEVNDSTNVIVGKSTVTIHVLKPITEFELDLVNASKAGTGMSVSMITQNGKSVAYHHTNNRLHLQLIQPASAGDELTLSITYSGVPADGLIIGRNKFGDRTFFGDNWPNRAHHWLPVIDHPSDKATCEFIVTAPGHYQVISNGKKMEESWVDNRRKVTHWNEATEISTKVMVIGIARFAVAESGRVHEIPVETWVYPQNRAEGFFEYEDAAKALAYFDRQIGPYSYEKLANVQSTTRYGGMENASAIFYAENALTGKKQPDGVIAHEIAHQWFGNSASETDWPHVWLSEGFATYLAHLFGEATDGRASFVERMKEDRQQVVEFAKTHRNPVIDTTTLDLMQLLNTNSYQKGSWVLHMLRHEVGDTNFWSGLKLYYQTYRNGNASSRDFQRAMEKVSGKNLSGFFDQWLWRSGNPQLTGTWEFDKKAKVVRIRIDQVQSGPAFQFNLDLKLTSASGESRIETVHLAQKSQKIEFSATSSLREITLDPEVWLLFEDQLSGH